jgi:sarcosine oxidase subunit gamma
MMMVLHRAGPEAFDIMVFRSMAASAVHELQQAMKALAARSAAF